MANSSYPGSFWTATSRSQPPSDPQGDEPAAAHRLADAAHAGGQRQPMPATSC